MTRPLTPTAAIKLARTIGHVSVVRAQEPDELPVWTIHLDGERPVFVALSWAEAVRVSNHWDRVFTTAADARIHLFGSE